VCNRIVVVNKGQLVKDIQTTPETLKDLEQYFSDQVSGIDEINGSVIKKIYKLQSTGDNSRCSV
jgi:hypothetical protein